MHTFGHIWLNAPFMKLLDFDNSCKCAFACRQLVYLHFGTWLFAAGAETLSSNMHLLKRYSKGTTMFDAPTKIGQRRPMFGVHWPIYIYTDCLQSVAVHPKPAATKHGLHAARVMQSFQRCNPVQLTDEPLSMRFEGKNVGLSLQTLLDSGANANFISPSVIQRLSIPVQPVAGVKLILADDTESVISGTVN